MNLEKWYFVGDVIEEGSEAYEILKNVPDLLEPMLEERKEDLKVVKTEEKKNGRKKSN